MSAALGFDFFFVQKKRNVSPFGQHPTIEIGAQIAPFNQPIGSLQSRKTPTIKFISFVPQKCRPISILVQLTRIASANPIAAGTWPWFVIVKGNMKWVSCGGVILSSDWIITSLQCCSTKMIVIAGIDTSAVEELEDYQNFQQYNIRDYHFHPHFDVCLLKVVKISFSTEADIDAVFWMTRNFQKTNVSKNQ